MSASERQFRVTASSLNSLPSVATARDGSMYVPADNVWVIADGVTDIKLKFDDVRSLITPSMLGGLKATLIWLLANRAATTAYNTVQSFRHLLGVIGSSAANPLGELTSLEISGYRAALLPRQVNRLHTLAILLRKWHALELPGVAQDVIALLDSQRLQAPVIGEAVRTMCPRRGPLTALEDEAYQSALNAAFAQGAIAEDAFFSAWLCRAIGQRPIQTASLKVCDLVVETRTHGTTDYFVRIPRAKQRGRLSRASSKVRPLIQQIGAPLHAYLEKLMIRFDGVVDDPKQLPMFPRSSPHAAKRGMFRWHRSGTEMARLHSDLSSKLKAFSERTGERLQVSATRLRRTVGTRAAQEGHGELVVAEILDHTNVASARYYVEAAPEIVARIDAATAKVMAPLARAFQGLAPEARDADPHRSENHIVDFRFDQSGRSMGECTGSTCSFLAPVACYTCRSFRPWIDGPHQAVLDDLLSRRQDQLARLGPRVASTHDRTILAVTHVIQICDRLKKGLARG